MRDRHLVTDMPRASLQGSQLHYFTHDVVRFFAHTVWQRPYEETSSGTSRNGTFCFDSDARAILRPSDPLTPLALRDAATRASELRRAAAWWVRHLRHDARLPPVFRVPGLGPRGVVIHARDTATVIVQRRPRRVWKLVRDASFSHLLEREREAARLAPALAPAVTDWHEPGPATPGYVCLEYTLDTEPLTRQELPGALRHITPALIDLYRRAGIAPTDAAAAGAEIARAEAVLASAPASPFTAAAASVLRDLGARVARLAAGSPALYRTFAHGDLQESNLRRSGSGVRVIDWANGGTHNVLFDALIVELFAPTPQVWAEVLTAGTLTDPGRGFNGWLPTYLGGLAEAGVALRGPDIAAGLVCSLAEKAAAIVARHARTDDARGLHSLARVERLLSAAPAPRAPT